jgi:hypothetical protein
MLGDNQLPCFYPGEFICEFQWDICALHQVEMKVSCCERSSSPKPSPRPKRMKEARSIPTAVERFQSYLQGPSLAQVKIRSSQDSEKAAMVLREIMLEELSSRIVNCTFFPRSLTPPMHSETHHTAEM